MDDDNIAPLLSKCADLSHVTIAINLANIAIACCCHRLHSLPQMLHLPSNGLIYRSPRSHGPWDGLAVPRWDARPDRPAAPGRLAEAPVHCAAPGSSGECAFAAHCDAPPGPAMCAEFRPSRSRQDADAGMPASAPASSLCSLGIPASKRRKSSAQRPALWRRARTSAHRKQRLSFSSTLPAACPQFSV